MGTITFYNNTSDNHVLNKNLTAIITATNVVYKKDCSILDPVVQISSVHDLSSVNYMHIADFSRYYYINDIKVVHDNLWEISGHVDVLRTYMSDINNCDAIVIRSENYYNNYMTDNVPLNADSIVVTKAFPSSFNLGDSSFVLITAGGGSN